MNAHRPTLLVVAWLGTLLLSRLPEISLREFLGIDPAAWMVWFWIFAGAALIVTAIIGRWTGVKSFNLYSITSEKMFDDYSDEKRSGSRSLRKHGERS